MTDYSEIETRTRAARAAGVPVTVTHAEAKQFARDLHYRWGGLPASAEYRRILDDSATGRLRVFGWPARVRPIRGTRHRHPTVSGMHAIRQAAERLLRP